MTAKALDAISGVIEATEPDPVGLIERVTAYLDAKAQSSAESAQAACAVAWLRRRQEWLGRMGKLLTSAEVAALIRARQKEGRKAVLGLATGSTPVSFYSELARLHREEGLSFANVVTFNLDEYYPIDPSHVQSFRHFMRAHLLDAVDLPAGQVHIPDGKVPKAGDASAT